MCKMTAFTTIRIEMTLAEAKAIITDPSDFVSHLQDMLPPEPYDPSEKSAAPRRAFQRRKLERRHCDICNRDISLAQWNKHQRVHNKGA